MIDVMCTGFESCGSKIPKDQISDWIADEEANGEPFIYCPDCWYEMHPEDKPKPDNYCGTGADYFLGTEGFIPLPFKECGVCHLNVVVLGILHGTPICGGCLDTK